MRITDRSSYIGGQSRRKSWCAISQHWPSPPRSNPRRRLLWRPAEGSACATAAGRALGDRRGEKAKEIAEKKAETGDWRMTQSAQRHRAKPVDICRQNDALLF